MKRIYHHYTKLEEYEAGLWRATAPEERDYFVGLAKQFMSDTEAFGAAMIRVIKEWKHSCEVSLTSPSVNHRSFLGRAACLLATGCPEDLTRIAWCGLPPDKQDAANAAADLAIAEWRVNAEA